MHCTFCMINVSNIKNLEYILYLNNEDINHFFSIITSLHIQRGEII